MRDVAPAGVTESASAASAAQATPNNLAQRTPGILCSPEAPHIWTIRDTPMTSWSDASLCERRANAGLRGYVVE